MRIEKAWNKFVNTKGSNKRIKNMKTTKQIAITPIVPARRHLTAKTVVPLLAVIIAAGMLATILFAQSAKEIRGATPYAEIANEPAPKLIVDPALPDLLDKGIVWIQYRTENVRIVPVFGKGALNVSPRVGHLHIHVDDLPWLWADASDLNTVDIAGMPAGEHKVTIELVDANHKPFPGQTKTVKFTVARTASSHEH
jgi:hypothetical protein